MFDGVFCLAPLFKNSPLFIVSFLMIGLYPQRLQVMLHCLFRATLFLKNSAQIIVRFRIIRIYSQRLQIMSHGFFHAILLFKSGAQIVMRHMIIGSDFKSMFKKLGAVFPISRLFPGRYYQNCKKEASQRGKPYSFKPPSRRKFGNAPGNDDRYTDKRNICIPVCHGLSAHLNQPDHRHKNAYVPQPPDNEIRTPFNSPHRQKRYEHKSQSSRRRLPPWQDCRMWIQNSQLGGIDHLADILRICDQGIGNSGFE